MMTTVALQHSVDHCNNLEAAALSSGHAGTPNSQYCNPVSAVNNTERRLPFYRERLTNTTFTSDPVLLQQADELFQKIKH